MDWVQSSLLVISVIAFVDIRIRMAVAQIEEEIAVLKLHQKEHDEMTGYRYQNGSHE